MESREVSSTVSWAELPAELLVDICRSAQLSGQCPADVIGLAGGSSRGHFCRSLISSMRITCKHWSTSLSAATTTLKPRSIAGAPPGWERRFSNLTTFALRNAARTTSTCNYVVQAQTCQTPPATSVPNLQLEQLCSLSRLAAMDLSHSHSLSDSGMAAVGKADSLTRLNISYCYRVTDVGLAFLAKLKELQHANLSGLYAITEQGLRSGLQQSYNLQSLRLNECTLLSDNALLALKKLPVLRDISVRGCIQLSNLTLDHLQSISSLEALDLSLCCGLTAKGLRPLATLPALRTLVLSGVTWVQRPAIPELYPLRHLTSIDLSSCINVDDATVEALANLKLDLQEINLERCHRVTDAGLAHLRLLPFLAHLNVLSCERVTLQGCRGLLQICTSLVLAQDPAAATVDLSELVLYLL